MSYITFGAWNVRTLLDRQKANRPARRTVLVAKELARYQIDIAALSKRGVVLTQSIVSVLVLKG